MSMDASPHKFECVFKGDRDYLQGADIFNAVREWLLLRHRPADVRRLDLSFRRLTSQRLEILDHVCPQGRPPVATVSCEVDGQVLRLWLFECGDMVQQRVPYDESRMTQGLEVDLAGRAARSEVFSPFSEMETWVALTKALHKACLPEVKARWVFARIVLPRGLDWPLDGVRQLIIEANWHHRLTRTRLERGGQRVGDMYFSVVED